ncbi:uncharacterized protein BDV17DRAFT_289984 [Aspergillus undulatus]|uniref:uncharacterized protein n=1 Tax=Aspergillus undulatus TaxID=1810928 RepID=UPI003CCE3EE1
MSFTDILGQLPLLKSYTHILLCFPLPDSQRDSVVDSLQCATKRLLSAFPFLAGVVVHKDIAPGHSGTFSVERFSDPDIDPEEKVTRILHIRDLSSVLPPYSALQSARAPPSMLPGTLVAPSRPAFPRIYTESSAPVLDIQASLISGGFLLTIAAQHNVIDATGIFYIAHVLSRLMDNHPDPIPAAEIALGNMDRSSLIPLLHDDLPLPKEMEMFTQEYPKPLPLEILAQFKWSLVHFPPESLKAIHDEAVSNPRDLVAGGEGVSVNDAVTAFVWKRLTLVRAAHMKAKEEGEQDKTDVEEPTTQLTRAADLRRCMSLSPAYMGHMVRTSNLRLSVSTVTNSSLSHLSSSLRACLKAHTTKASITNYATLLSRTSDKSKLLYAGEFNPLNDFSVSSVAHVEMPSFGRDLGRPEFVRRPTFGPLPGGMYVGPGSGRGPGGQGLDAVVCLRGWEVEGLTGDPEWNRFVEFVE